MAVQLALATGLIATAGGLTGIWYRLWSAEHGFAADNAVSARVSLAGGHYASLSSRREVIARLVQALSESGEAGDVVGVADTLPLTQPERSAQATGGAASIEPPVMAGIRLVSRDYFRAVGMSFVSGATFASERPATDLTLVANEAFARRALGEALPRHTVIFAGRTWQVTGILANTRSPVSLAEAGPELYVPYSRVDLFTPRLAERALLNVTIVWRTNLLPAAAGERLRAIVHHVSPLAAVSEVMTLNQRLNVELRDKFVYSLIAIGFGTLALLLVGAGLVATCFQSIVGRRRELVVRLALGGTPRAVVRDALAIGTTSLALGVSFGALLALGSGFLLRAGSRRGGRPKCRNSRPQLHHRWGCRAPRARVRRLARSAARRGRIAAIRVSGQIALVPTGQMDSREPSQR